MKIPVREKLAMHLGWTELAWDFDKTPMVLEGIPPGKGSRSRVPPFETSMASCWRLVEEMVYGPIAVNVHYVEGDEEDEWRRDVTWFGPKENAQVSASDQRAPYAIVAALVKIHDLLASDTRKGLRDSRLYDAVADRPWRPDQNREPLPRTPPRGKLHSVVT